MPGLRFFAAESSPHAPRLHAHIVQWQAQRMRHPMLHFAGVLRAGMNQPLAHLLRLRNGDLTF